MGASRLKVDTHKRDEQLHQVLEDPDTYFDAAWRRAYEDAQAERDASFRGEVTVGRSVWVSRRARRWQFTAGLILIFLGFAALFVAVLVAFEEHATLLTGIAAGVAAGSAVHLLASSMYQRAKRR